MSQTTRSRIRSGFRGETTAGQVACEGVDLSGDPVTIHTAGFSCCEIQTTLHGALKIMLGHQAAAELLGNLLVTNVLSTTPRTAIPIGSTAEEPEAASDRHHSSDPVLQPLVPRTGPVTRY